MSVINFQSQKCSEKSSFLNVNSFLQELVSKQVSVSRMFFGTSFEYMEQIASSD